MFVYSKFIFIYLVFFRGDYSLWFVNFFCGNFYCYFLVWLWVMILVGLESGIRFGSLVFILEEGLMFLEGKLRKNGCGRDGDELGREEGGEVEV